MALLLILRCHFEILLPDYTGIVLPWKQAKSDPLGVPPFLLAPGHTLHDNRTVINTSTEAMEDITIIPQKGYKSYSGYHGNRRKIDVPFFPQPSTNLVIFLNICIMIKSSAGNN